MTRSRKHRPSLKHTPVSAQPDASQKEDIQELEDKQDSLEVSVPHDDQEADAPHEDSESPKNIPEPAESTPEPPESVSESVESISEPAESVPESPQDEDDLEPENDQAEEEDANDSGESSDQTKGDPNLLRSIKDKAKPVWSTVQALWHKRPRIPLTLLAVVFILISSTAVIFLQLSVLEDPVYAEGQDVDEGTRIVQSQMGQLSNFITQTWLSQNYLSLLNLLIVALVYLVLVVAINRFWIATAVFGSGAIALSVANHFKVQLRNEPVLPSDLSFVTSGNTENLLSFLSKKDLVYISDAVHGIVIFAIVCVVLQFLDGRNGLIPVRWRPNIIKAAPKRAIAFISARVLTTALCLALLLNVMFTFNTDESWSRRLAASMSDSPIYWSTLQDAQTNGAAVALMRLAHTKAMEHPSDYSRNTMEEIAERYASAAKTINAKRSQQLTDNTVIMILSESFSDPTRVPGVVLGDDPMPHIRSLKESTTAGLMLSTGYGGGTANIEYQSLTGLAMANFDSSMQTPYQQLVPHQKTPFSFNQLWNEAYGKNGSTAFHPYQKSMYLRDTDYRKFQFEELRTLDSTNPVKHQDRIDDNPYVSDAASYENVLDELKSTKHAQFIQLTTMQNHATYSDWYSDNPFKADPLHEVTKIERNPIQTYAKGVSLTDQATADFLGELNDMDRPITVIFYGDHLPGIYSTANSDPNNSLALHETDYFIWSNKASQSHDTKLSEKSTNFTTSNYFMAQAAEHMDAKVTPYLALLTQLHRQIPAISRVVVTEGGFGDGTATYLDHEGNEIQLNHLSKKAKQLLHDYQLVQYDMTVGKGYLRSTDFTLG